LELPDICYVWLDEIVQSVLTEPSSVIEIKVGVFKDSWLHASGEEVPKVVEVMLDSMVKTRLITSQRM